MSTNGFDGRFGLDCCTNVDKEGDGQEEFSDDVDELRVRAEFLINAGRFGYIELSQFNFATEEWDHMETFESD
jgi:hypothetical protein